MTKKWTFSMESEQGGYIEFTTANTATTGTSYAITSASGVINGKQIIGLVETGIPLYSRTVQNLIKNSEPYSIGLVDSTGNKYFFTSTAGTYLLAPSSDIGTWLTYDDHFLTVTESNSGASNSQPSANADTLVGTSGNDQIDGLAGNDTISGLAGDDAITGGAGVDQMSGGAGSDSYNVDNVSDVVTENANEGDDSVYSSVTYTIGTHVENLYLTGTAAINGTGSETDNYIVGNEANNILDGAGGYNRLVGGVGNDTFLVSQGTNDIYGGAGTDTLKLTLVAKPAEWQIKLQDDYIKFIYGSGSQTVDAWIPDNDIENVYFATSSKGGASYTLKIGSETTASNLVGVTKADLLIAGFGNDSLDGGSGSDVMVGGAGDDAYVVDNTTDVVLEYDAGGTDSVTAGLTHTLSQYVENLILTGTRNINGTGNASANSLKGNSGKNTLSGLEGNDTLIGGGGQDTLTGGQGNDVFKFLEVIDSPSKAGDSITDFASGIDQLDLALIDANQGLTGDQAFTFIGSKGFSKTAGELRFASGLLYGDTNGDGKVDFQIKLVGVTELLSQDFIL